MTPRDNVKQRFQALAAKWKTETGPSSSIQCDHPAYRAIIDLGSDVIPILLAELKREPDHWHIALYELTGVNPVPECDIGNIKKMSEAWVKWGEHNGLLPLESDE